MKPFAERGQLGSDGTINIPAFEYYMESKYQYHFGFVAIYTLIGSLCVRACACASVCVRETLCDMHHEHYRCLAYCMRVCAHTHTASIPSTSLPPPLSLFLAQ
jgi:thiaminase